MPGGARGIRARLSAVPQSVRTTLLILHLEALRIETPRLRSAKEIA
jgi:hypothetical protein